MVAALIAGGLGIAALEAHLRSEGTARLPALSNVYDFYENNGAGSVQLIAGYRGSQVVEGRRVRTDVNSLGMRGPEVPPRQPDEFRVLVLGDSTAFGHGVEAEEALPARLEVLLRERLQVPVTVGNAGVPGASHRDQVAQLDRHLAPFDPDLVLSCVYTGNDFEGDYFGPKRAIDGYWFGTEAARFIESSWRARLCLHSRAVFVFEQILSEHLPALAMDRSALAPTPEEAARYAAFTRPRYEGLFMDEVDAPPIVAEVVDRIAQTLADLAARAPGARVVAAILPSFAQTWPGVHALALKANGMDPALFQAGLGARRLAARCAAAGVPCTDLTPAIIGHGAPQRLYLPTDLHFSVEGNAFAAERLAPELLPPASSVSIVSGTAPRVRWVGSTSVGPSLFSSR